MSARNLPICWNQIDELTRRDHAFLKADDVCAYLADFSVRGDHIYWSGNRLLAALLSPGGQEGDAVARAASAVRRAMGWRGDGGIPQSRQMEGWSEAGSGIWGGAQPGLQRETGSVLRSMAAFVPIPSLRSASNPVLQVLQSLGQGAALDIRELIVAVPPKPGARLSKPKDFAAHYRIGETSVQPLPEAIALFGACLAAGAQFRAAKDMLAARFKGVPIYGFFLARQAKGSTAEDS